MKRRSGLAAVAAALLVLASRAVGQDSAASAITLMDAARLALDRSPGLAVAVEQVRERTGQADAARGAFDVQFRSFASRDSEHSPLGELLPVGAVEPGATSHVTYGLGASRRFRSGLLVAKEAGLVRTEAAGAPYSPNVSTARLTATVPLLRGRGSAGLPTASEQAASLSEHAAALQLREVAAQTVLDVGFRYWRYAVTHGEVAIHRRAEERARRLAEETRTLVAMDERPASDLTQLRANLAYREAVRIEAEQRLIEYRHHLGLAIGLFPEEMRRIPDPTESFPAVTLYGIDGDSLAAALLEVALRERADLAAAEQRRRAAEARWAGAMSERRPRLDLALRIGYSGAELGTGFDQLFTPFVRNVGGISSAIEMSYQWTSRNRTARGIEMQGQAQLEQRTIEVANLERTIRSNVATVVDVLRLTVAEMERSSASIELHREVIEAEKTKYGIGMSTLFDVIHAEEGLTRAEVAHLFTLERHALTLLVLRRETGTLVDAGPGRVPALPADGLTAIPDASAWDAERMR
jgi:outer membrane protein